MYVPNDEMFDEDQTEFEMVVRAWDVRGRLLEEMHLLVEEATGDRNLAMQKGKRGAVMGFVTPPEKILGWSIGFLDQMKGVESYAIHQD